MLALVDYYGEKESNAGRSGVLRKSSEAVVAEQYQQHGGHPESVQGNHRRAYGKRSGCRVGRGTGLKQVRLSEQGNGQQPGGRSSKRLKTSFGEVEESVSWNEKLNFCRIFISI